MPDPISKSKPNPQQALTEAAPSESSSADLAELAPEDFYMDGPYFVFTAAYHLKRGYCCNSDCRHCPYH